MRGDPRIVVLFDRQRVDVRRPPVLRDGSLKKKPLTAPVRQEDADRDRDALVVARSCSW